MSSEEQKKEPVSPKNEQQVERPGFHQSIKGAVFNIELYDTFRKVSTGSAASFFALFVFVITIFNTLDASFVMSKEFGKFSRFWAANFPDISIKDGRATALTNVKMPIKAVYNDFGGDIIIVVDTTGATKELVKNEHGVLITDTKIIRQTADGRIVQSNIKELFQTDTVINKDSIISVQNAILFKFFPFILLIGYLITLFLVFIQAGLLSVAGLLMSRYMKLELFFTSMFNIVMYSFVPALLAVTMLNIFGFFRLLNSLVGISGSQLIFLLIGYTTVVVYMGLVLNMLKKKTSEDKSSDLAESAS